MRMWCTSNITLRMHNSCTSCLRNAPIKYKAINADSQLVTKAQEEAD
jgi:hypothetical protein